MKIQVFTRSRNNALYDMMRQFIPEDIECVRCTGFDQWYEASDYIYYMIKSAEEWVVNLDEDAFVVNWNKIVSLAEYMKREGFDYAGHPDFGCIPHRRWDWITMNPFFNIFNAKRIRERMNETTRNNIDSCGFYPDMEHLRPDWITGEPYRGGTEPFNGFFYWCIGLFKPLFLKAKTFPDGISTISLDNEEHELLYHSWYSREFDTVPSQRNRILNIYNKAKGDKIEWTKNQ